MSKECCGYYLHPLNAFEVSPVQSPWTRRHCVALCASVPSNAMFWNMNLYIFMKLLPTAIQIV